jgi:ABC-2 type transport system ATP-binding protein
MIQAEHLSKTYPIIEKEVGLKGSITAFFKPKKKSIPAVQDISLQVEKGK